MLVIFAVSSSGLPKVRMSRIGSRNGAGDSSRKSGRERVRLQPKRSCCASLIIQVAPKLGSTSLSSSALSMRWLACSTEKVLTDWSLVS